eukprot:jgi/Ulvmu1/7347/UM036_0007.1
MLSAAAMSLGEPSDLSSPSDVSSPTQAPLCVVNDAKLSLQRQNSPRMFQNVLYDDARPTPINGLISLDGPCRPGLSAETSVPLRSPHEFTSTWTGTGEGAGAGLRHGRRDNDFYNDSPATPAHASIKDVQTPHSWNYNRAPAFVANALRDLHSSPTPSGAAEVAQILFSAPRRSPRKSSTPAAQRIVPPSVEPPQIAQEGVICDDRMTRSMCSPSAHHAKPWGSPVLLMDTPARLEALLCTPGAMYSPSISMDPLYEELLNICADGESVSEAMTPISKIAVQNDTSVPQSRHTSPSNLVSVRIADEWNCSAPQKQDQTSVHSYCPIPDATCSRVGTTQPSALSGTTLVAMPAQSAQAGISHRDCNSVQISSRVQVKANHSRSDLEIAASLSKGSMRRTAAAAHPGTPEDHASTTATCMMRELRASSERPQELLAEAAQRTLAGAHAVDQGTESERLGHDAAQCFPANSFCGRSAQPSKILGTSQLSALDITSPCQSDEDDQAVRTKAAGRNKAKVEGRSQRQQSSPFVGDEPAAVCAAASPSVPSPPQQNPQPTPGSWLLAGLGVQDSIDEVPSSLPELTDEQFAFASAQGTRTSGRAGGSAQEDPAPDTALNTDDAAPYQPTVPGSVPASSKKVIQAAGRVATEVLDELDFIAQAPAQEEDSAAALRPSITAVLITANNFEYTSNSQTCAFSDATVVDLAAPPAHGEDVCLLLSCGAAAISQARRMPVLHSHANACNGAAAQNPVRMATSTEVNIRSASPCEESLTATSQLSDTTISRPGEQETQPNTPVALRPSSGFVASVSCPQSNLRSTPAAARPRTGKAHSVRSSTPLNRPSAATGSAAVTPASKQSLARTLPLSIDQTDTVRLVSVRSLCAAMNPSEVPVTKKSCKDDLAICPGTRPKLEQLANAHIACAGDGSDGVGKENSGPDNVFPGLSGSTFMLPMLSSQSPIKGITQAKSLWGVACDLPKLDNSERVKDLVMSPDNPDCGNRWSLTSPPTRLLRHSAVLMTAYGEQLVQSIDVQADEDCAGLHRQASYNLPVCSTPPMRYPRSSHSDQTPPTGRGRTCRSVHAGKSEHCCTLPSTGRGLARPIHVSPAGKLLHTGTGRCCKQGEHTRWGHQLQGRTPLRIGSPLLQAAAGNEGSLSCLKGCWAMNDSGGCGALRWSDQDDHNSIKAAVTWCCLKLREILWLDLQDVSGQLWDQIMIAWRTSIVPDESLTLLKLFASLLGVCWIASIIHELIFLGQAATTVSRDQQLDRAGVLASSSLMTRPAAFVPNNDLQDMFRDQLQGHCSDGEACPDTATAVVVMTHGIVKGSAATKAGDAAATPGREERVHSTSPCCDAAARGIHQQASAVFSPEDVPDAASLYVDASASCMPCTACSSRMHIQPPLHHEPFTTGYYALNAWSGMIHSDEASGAACMKSNQIPARSLPEVAESDSHIIAEALAPAPQQKATPPQPSVEMNNAAFLPMVTSVALFHDVLHQFVSPVADVSGETNMTIGTEQATEQNGREEKAVRSESIIMLRNESGFQEASNLASMDRCQHGHALVTSMSKDFKHSTVKNAASAWKQGHQWMLPPGIRWLMSALVIACMLRVTRAWYSRPYHSKQIASQDDGHSAQATIAGCTLNQSNRLSLQNFPTMASDHASLRRISLRSCQDSHVGPTRS